VLALSPRQATARRLALAWGVETRIVPDIHDLEEMPALATRQAVESGLASAGERIVITAGVPMGSPGAANLLRLVHIPTT
jgi:pyruvate kinase